MVKPAHQQDGEKSPAKARAKDSPAAGAATPVAPAKREEQQDSPKPVSSPTKGRLNIGKVSLKINQPAETDVRGQAGAQHADPERPKAVFTYDDLLNHWKNLAKSYKNTSPALYVAMTKRKPALLQDHVIMVYLDNAIQQDIIHEKKPELLGYLHSKLNNFSLGLATEIRSQGSGQKIYLPKEKLQALIKKNPDVKMLQDEFGLDVDY